MNALLGPSLESCSVVTNAGCKQLVEPELLDTVADATCEIEILADEDEDDRLQNSRIPTPSG